MEQDNARFERSAETFRPEQANGTNKRHIVDIFKDLASK